MATTTAIVTIVDSDWTSLHDALSVADAVELLSQIHSGRRNKISFVSKAASPGSGVTAEASGGLEAIGIRTRIVNKPSTGEETWVRSWSGTVTLNVHTVGI